MKTDDCLSLFDVILLFTYWNCFWPGTSLLDDGRYTNVCFDTQIGLHDMRMSRTIVSFIFMTCWPKQDAVWKEEKSNECFGRLTVVKFIHGWMLGNLSVLQTGQRSTVSYTAKQNHKNQCKYGWLLKIPNRHVWQTEYKRRFEYKDLPWQINVE